MSKEVKEGSWESRGAQKARKKHGLRNFAAKSDPLWKSLSAAKWFHSLLAPSTKIFAAGKGPLGTWVPFRSQVHSFRSYEMAGKPPRLEILHFATETPFGRVFRSCETTLWHTSAISQPRTLISQLRNGCEILHALKSFSAHTMKPHPHFGNCWTHFGALPGAQIFHTISCFKA